MIDLNPVEVETICDFCNGEPTLEAFNIVNPDLGPQTLSAICVGCATDLRDAFDDESDAEGRIIVEGS